MTACVQNEKLKAKSSPKLTAIRPVTSGDTLADPSFAPHQGIIQRNIDAASSEVAPTASAPHTPLKILISQAAFPRGSNWKSQASNVQSG